MAETLSAEGTLEHFKGVPDRKIMPLVIPRRVDRLRYYAMAIRVVTPTVLLDLLDRVIIDPGSEFADQRTEAGIREDGAKMAKWMLKKEVVAPEYIELVRDSATL